MIRGRLRPPDRIGSRHLADATEPCRETILASLDGNSLALVWRAENPAARCQQSIGNAVSDLIFSKAKRDVTFLSGKISINRL